MVGMAHPNLFDTYKHSGGKINCSLAYIEHNIVRAIFTLTPVRIFITSYRNNLEWICGHYNYPEWESYVSFYSQTARFTALCSTHRFESSVFMQIQSFIIGLAGDCVCVCVPYRLWAYVITQSALKEKVKCGKI